MKKLPQIIPFLSLFTTGYTDNKENKIFLIKKGNSDGSSCKVIYEEGLPNICGNAQ
jgi:hypothetical protein